MIKPKHSVLNLECWPMPKKRGGCLCLNLNENMFITPEKIKGIISELNLFEINQYPEYDRLTLLIAKYSGVKSPNVLLTNGADQAIELVLRTFNRKKRVLMILPTFSYYQHVCAVEGISIKKIFFNKRFDFPLNQILKNIQKDIDGVLLCNPSNPLSTAIQPNEIIQIIRKAKKCGCFVVVDEVYFEFHKSSLQKEIRGFNNLIIIRSFSKGHGLAGLRLGYIISDKENISQFKKVRGPWDVNGFSVAFVLGMIHNKEWLSFLPDMNKIKKELILLLQKKKWKVLDSHTNFLTFQVPDAEVFVHYMKKHRVLVCNLSSYPDSNGILKNYIRMGIPNKQDKDRIIGLLAKYDLFG